MAAESASESALRVVEVHVVRIDRIAATAISHEYRIYVHGPSIIHLGPPVLAPALCSRANTARSLLGVRDYGLLKTCIRWR